jgi:hypothetical protein
MQLRGDMGHLSPESLILDNEFNSAFSLLEALFGLNDTNMVPPFVN